MRSSLLAIRPARGARVLPVAALTLTLAMALAACGSSSDDSAASPSSGTSSPSSDTAALGTANAATGEPVKIGFVADGLTPTIDTTNEIKGAVAAADYANKYLGGINGRPIQYVTCEDKGTPAGAQDCATQFVSQKVAAINAGSPGQMAPILKGASEAGIPIFAGLISDTDAINNPDALVFGNPLAPFGSAAAFAKEKGDKKAAVLVIDVPAASGPAKQLAPAFFKNAGSAAEVIAVPPGTADMTPQIQAAAAKGVDLIHIIGNPSFCTSALKAIKTLALKVDITMLDRCIDPTGAKSISGGYAGVTIIAQANQNPTSEEFKLFSAVMKTAKLPLTADTVSGYTASLNMVRALNAAKVTDYSPAGLLAAVKGAPATPFALGDGATMKCDGTAVSIAKSVCSVFGVVGDSDKDGNVTNYRTINGDGIYKLG
jgi:branched-chain amino acid transport system substrate-binding protein